MRWKWAVLPVTSVRPWVRAMAAIMGSAAPMGWPGAFEVGGDASGELGAGLVEIEDFLGRERVQDGLDAVGAINLLEALDDFHERDGRDCQPAKGDHVGCRLSGNLRVHALEEFGEDVGVEQRLIH